MNSMKTKIMAVGLPCFLLSSCSGLLDLAPLSEANVENFFENSNDYVIATNGVYAALKLNGQFGHVYWMFGEMRSDNTRYGRPVAEGDVDTFSDDANTSFTRTYWRDHYNGISRANTVLDRLAVGGMDNTALQERLVGEAKFLRALMYFNLVRAFGDVPLVLHDVRSVPEGYSYLREPSAKVYEQIIVDLRDAASKLPVSYTGNNVGRATRGAANALLGKVHLTIKDYASARSALEAVIIPGGYQLWPSYQDVFRPNNAHGRESIFEVNFKAGGIGQGSNYMYTFSPYPYAEPVLGVGSGTGLNPPTDEMIASYETGDRRKDVSMKEGFFRANGEWVDIPYVFKYHVQPFAPGDTDANWIVLRYADVLLMYAEVLNELNQPAEALPYVNQIRERAGLPALTGLNQIEARRAIEHERRMELAFEGHRWWDLVRTGNAVEAINSKGHGFTIQPYQTLFPIPQTEIDINPNLTQNPGW
jgi:starch-binding outer membrane protein, SusD/RagB family